MYNAGFSIAMFIGSCNISVDTSSNTSRKWQVSCPCLQIGGFGRGQVPLAKTPLQFEFRIFSASMISFGCTSVQHVSSRRSVVLYSVDIARDR